MKNKGITLIALVITIIILLILAGIAISQLTGSGLFENSRLAQEKYDNSQLEEEQMIKEYENTIISKGVIGDRDSDTVTLTKEQFEALVPNKIQSDSLLYTATNTSTTVNTYTLKNFTPVLGTKFNSYFSYNEDEGELECKKDGWYLISLKIVLYTTNRTSDYESVNMNFFQNGLEIGKVIALVGTGTNDDFDNNSFMIYCKKGDILTCEKIVGNSSINTSNATLKIIKY